MSAVAPEIHVRVPAEDGTYRDEWWSVEQLMELLSHRVQVLTSPQTDSVSEAISAPVARVHQGAPLYGILASLGPVPSEDDIADARRAMWGTFPREDI
jgi:hypothetical protein